MNPRELRIGNIVVYPGWHKNGADRFFCVKGIHLEELTIALHDNMISTVVDLRAIKPVLFTGEWCVKFGFELDKEDKSYYQGLIEVRQEGFKVWYAETVDDVYTPIKRVKYVHQFQNLCFDLTEQELQLKLWSRMNEGGR